MKTTNIVFLLVLFIVTNHYKAATAQELSPERIYDNSKDAVFVVESYDKNDKYYSQGSCVYIAERGMIITNYHNYEDADYLKIKHGNEYVSYNQIIGVDIERDLLILSTDYKTPSNIVMGNSSNIKIGQKVYAIGSPLGYENSLSDGIVAGLERDFPKINKKNLIQITAIINHGSSGGAVLNSTGELIGISSFLEDNIYFAIPVEKVLRVPVVQNGDRSIEQQLYLIKADKYYNKKDFSYALYYYNKYINENKSNPDVYLQRGYCYLKLDKIKEAKSDFDLVMSMTPQDPKAINAIADYYYEIKQYEKSEAEFRKALAIDQQNFYATARRGDIYAKLNNYSIAIREYTKAMEMTEDKTSILMQRSVAYFYSEEYSKAFVDLDMILEKEPQNEDAKILKEKYKYLIEYQAKTDAQTKALIFNAIIDFGNAIIKGWGR